MAYFRRVEGAFWRVFVTSWRKAGGAEPNFCIKARGATLPIFIISRGSCHKNDGVFQKKLWRILTLLCNFPLDIFNELSE